MEANQTNQFETPQSLDPLREPPTNKVSSKTPASLFGPDLVLEGKLNSEGDIQFDGRLDGSVRAGTLTIGDSAEISGEIVANTVIIRGRVMGTVRAREVQLAAQSKVQGDIYHTSLSVESGAFFEGQCKHMDDPFGDERPAGASGKSKTSKPQSSTSDQGGLDKAVKEDKQSAAA